MNPNPIKEKVLAFLAENELRYQDQEDTPNVRVGFSGDNCDVEAWLECWPEAGRLKVYVYPSVKFPPAVQGRVLDFLNRANWNLGHGSFELAPENNLIRYRASTLTDGVTLEADAIGSMLWGSVGVVDDYLPGLMAVAWGGVSAADALAALAKKEAEEA